MSAEASRRIVCLRHGRTSWNVAGRVQGQQDVPLDEVGVAQAKVAASRLASLNPTRILSSDLQRAANTARALSDMVGVPVEFDERFREMTFGIREGLTWPESWEKYPAQMEAWVAGDETKFEGSETHLQAAERFAAGLHEYVEKMPEGETWVVVAHGAVLRTGVCSFVGIEHASWRKLGALSNCHWTVLEESSAYDGDHWRIAEWNAGTIPEPTLAADDQ